MRIGYENGIIEDQLVASTSLNLNYPISKVLDLHMTEKYKSLGSGSLLITMRDESTVGTDNAVSINASMCVLNAHNMVSGDTATLKGYPTATSSSASVTESFTFQEYGMAVIFDEVDLFWEIELTVTNQVEIGGIYLGPHLITPAYEIGARTDHIVHDSYSMSGSGQLFGDEGYEGRKNNWLFPWIAETEKPDWLTFFRAVGTIVPFYLLQYPDRQDIQPVIYCHRTNKTFKLEEHEGNRSLYKDIPLSTEEVF